VVVVVPDVDMAIPAATTPINTTPAAIVPATVPAAVAAPAAAPASPAAAAPASPAATAPAPDLSAWAKTLTGTIKLITHKTAINAQNFLTTPSFN
jgi:hypothetical protein